MHRWIVKYVDISQKLKEHWINTFGGFEVTWITEQQHRTIYFEGRNCLEKDSTDLRKVEDISKKWQSLLIGWWQRVRTGMVISPKITMMILGWRKNTYEWVFHLCGCTAEGRGKSAHWVPLKSSQMNGGDSGEEKEKKLPSLCVSKKSWMGAEQRKSYRVVGEMISFSWEMISLRQEAETLEGCSTNCGSPSQSGARHP